MTNTSVHQQKRVNGWKVFGYTVLTWLGLSLVAALIAEAMRAEHPGYSQLDATSMAWSWGALVVSIVTAVKIRRGVEVLWGLLAWLLRHLPLLGVFVGIAYLAWCYAKIERHKLAVDAGGATAASTSRNKPTIPEVSDTLAVVTWFVHHDDKISDLRSRFPTALTAFRDEVVREINAIGNADRLQRYLSELRHTTRLRWRTLPGNSLRAGNQPMTDIASQPPQRN